MMQSNLAQISNNRSYCLTEVKEKQKSDIFSVDSSSDVVCEFDKRCLGYIVFLEACLHAVENVVRVNVSINLFVYYVFSCILEAVK